MKDRDLFYKNAPKWKPTNEDYRLVFRPLEDGWREISMNLPQYANMLLADYLAQMEIPMPDGCTFMRIRRDDLYFEYRDMDAYVRIDVVIYNTKNNRYYE